MKKIILILTLVSILSGGCKKYLTTNPSVAVSEQKLLESVSGFETLLRGVYRIMKNQQAGIGPGIMGLQRYTAQTSPDIWNRFDGNLNYQGSIFLPQRTEAGSAPSNQTWIYFYTIINNCNIILTNIDRLSSPADRIAIVKGQALAIRGWCYFNLVRFYQHTYSIAKERPGVPIYLTPATPERPQADRSTVEQVYTQAEKDLLDGLAALANYVRPSKDYINKDVINGILANLYLTKEDWAKAATFANTARQTYPLMSRTEFRSGFQTRNAEWMWCFYQTAEDNLRAGNHFAYWASNGHRNPGTIGGIPFTRINSTFRAIVDPADVRSQFKLVAGFTNEWTSDKFRDDPNFFGDMLIMRGAEMLLIEAEALARQNQLTEARTLLNQLQVRREVPVAQQTTTAVQTELIDAILLERRKELFGEGEQIFFDFIRNKLPLTKAGDAADQFTIPARSWQFIIQIPENEVLFGGISNQNPLTGVF
ncbi:RagB/SusD family nutrient uptake outer membrane protein [Lacibacter sp.]|uniref:RagB/SusD family nutrient uptake outer membrane protein n=1 Tax=Lacibacter sp. TaxID=1915409 RepID=UPI002B4B521C|nr:RagB/SusD family nutrient uptake outer membrane protein [Lacibacter sp.]HLP37632.1 RagB/SusD family nutrient uptake outer membrane protein [Lacibacter sp.]